MLAHTTIMIYIGGGHSTWKHPQRYVYSYHLLLACTSSHVVSNPKNQGWRQAIQGPLKTLTLLRPHLSESPEGPDPAHQALLSVRLKRLGKWLDAIAEGSQGSHSTPTWLKNRIQECGWMPRARGMTWKPNQSGPTLERGESTGGRTQPLGCRAEASR